MLVEYKPYQIPETLLNIPILSLRERQVLTEKEKPVELSSEDLDRHYVDMYHQAIVIKRKEKIKTEIIKRYQGAQASGTKIVNMREILSKDCDSKRIGILENSIISFNDGLVLKIESTCKNTNLEAKPVHGKKERTVFIPAIQPGQSTRNRDQTRMWVI